MLNYKGLVTFFGFQSIPRVFHQRKAIWFPGVKASDLNG